MNEDYSDFLDTEPEKTFTERLVDRLKNQPFLVVGWAGTLGALAYGGYRYKTRGPTINSSSFIVQLRVFAQGALVSSLFLGMLHQSYLEYSKRKENERKSEH